MHRTELGMEQRNRGIEELRTECEINNNILRAELASHVALGVSKPRYRRSPLGCIDRIRSRKSDSRRRPASLDLLKWFSETEGTEAG
jgi:hypothetical protein